MCSTSSRVSADAVATVGVTESMLTIVYTVAIGLGIGATRRGRAPHRREGRRGRGAGAAQAIALGLIVAVAVGVFGFFNAERLLRLMGATPSMIDVVARLHAGDVRRQRHRHAAVPEQRDLPRRRRSGDRHADAVARQRDQHRASVRCLIFGLGPFPELGVTGAAVATNIGRGTAVLTQLWMLASGASRITSRRRISSWCRR